MNRRKLIKAMAAAPVALTLPASASIASPPLMVGLTPTQELAAFGGQALVDAYIKNIYSLGAMLTRTGEALDA